MSNNGKMFVNFAVGWDHPEKDDMIRCWADENNTTVGKNKEKIKLFIENEAGERVQITNFFIKKRDKKMSKNGKPLPNYEFTAVVE